MKAVMYGAGNIGRGFIGQVFAQSGYELTFIDVAEPVVAALNRDGRYPVRLLSESGCRDVWIEGVKAVNGNNAEDAARAIAEADIMATAVGVRVLPFIAPVIAAGLEKRFSGGKCRPLNIIICENLIDADAVLGRLVKENLGGKALELFDENVGLVKASIGRMVPLQTVEMQDGNPLRVCVEPYSLLPVDGAAFKGAPPPLEGMRAFANFDFYIQRKLFIHNMGHGICAYLGMIGGDTFIYESAGRGGALFIAQSAMMESALALSAKYGEPLAELYGHIQDLLGRFSNKALADTCARVGADITRKLGKKDRFAGALLCCAEEGVPAPFVSAGAAAALYCYLKEKGLPQDRESALSALLELSGLDDAAAGKVLLFHSLLAPFARPGDFDKIIEKIIKAAYTEK